MALGDLAFFPTDLPGVTLETLAVAGSEEAPTSADQGFFGGLFSAVSDFFKGASLATRETLNTATNTLGSVVDFEKNLELALNGGQVTATEKSNTGAGTISAGLSPFLLIAIAAIGAFLLLRR